MAGLNFLLTAGNEPAGVLKNDLRQFRSTFAVRRQNDNAFGILVCHAPCLPKGALCLFVRPRTDLALHKARQQRRLGSQQTDYRNQRFGYG